MKYKIGDKVRVTDINLSSYDLVGFIQDIDSHCSLKIPINVRFNQNQDGDFYNYFGEEHIAYVVPPEVMELEIYKVFNEIADE